MRESQGVRVVLIHGAYTSAWHWHRLVPLLEAEGWEVVVPELPCDDADAGVERYVEVVEESLAGDPEPPLVVGSSLGAVTACVVAARRPVRGLVTVCGVIPSPGRPVGGDSGAMAQPAYWSSIDAHEDGSTTFRPEAAVELVFHESAPELAREAAARLRRQAAQPFLDPCPYEALPEIPRRGIVVPGDRLLRPEWLAAAVRERLGVEPTEIETDHTPMLSQPDLLAEVLLERLET